MRSIITATLAVAFALATTHAATKAADIESADLLFANALDAVIAGKDVANAKSQPYGCGVKY
ncbi:MAG: hypothetical protein OSA84_05935 [Akkermansiaceae bacterium]|nr:hypothetical protein [Akkermansiaceae bacterium]